MHKVELFHHLSEIKSEVLPMFEMHVSVYSSLLGLFTLSVNIIGNHSRCLISKINSNLHALLHSYGIAGPLPGGFVWGQTIRRLYQMFASWPFSLGILKDAEKFGGSCPLTPSRRLRPCIASTTSTNTEIMY